MGGLAGKLRGGWWKLLAQFVVLGTLGSPGHGQLGQLPVSTQAPQLPTPPGQTTTRVPFGEDPDNGQDPALRKALLEATKKRNIDRQNRIVADTDKLVHLAEQLNGELSGKGPSMAEMKKAEEIEKLARSVKDRMRSE